MVKSKSKLLDQQTHVELEALIVDATLLRCKAFSQETPT